jgi:hypothetical protein
VTASALASALASLGLLAAVTALPAPVRAQCDRPVVGDHLFTNEPAPLPCVAPPPDHPPLRFGVGLALGGQHDEAAGARPAWGPVAHVDLGLSELFEVGVRAGIQLRPDRGVDEDGDGADDASDPDAVSLVATAGPRLVLRTNAARYEAIRLSVDFGALVVLAGDARSGPVVAIGVERQVGTLYVGEGYTRASHGTALGVTLGVHAQQGLGDAGEHRAIFVSATSGLELGAPLPDGRRPRRVRPTVEHTFSGAVGGGLSLGERGGAGGALELGVGFPIGEWLAIETRADAMLLGRTETGDPTVFFAALGGLRAPRFFPVFVQALAGYAWGFGTEPLEIGQGAVLDLQAGLQLSDVFGCGLGTFAAVHNRFGLSARNEGLAFVGFVLGIRHDSLLGAATCEP